MERPFKDKRPVGPFVSSSNIRQYDREVSPLVVIREFHKDINSGTDSASYHTMWGTLRYDTSYGALDMSFTTHESVIENKFEFNPASNASSGGRTIQGSSLEDLGGKPGEFASLFKKIYKGKPLFEFANLDAASLGHQYLTDYEFTYEISAFKSAFTNVDLDERVRKVMR